MRGYEVSREELDGPGAADYWRKAGSRDQELMNDKTQPRPAGWTVREWQAAYAAGTRRLEDLVAYVEQLPADDPVWITRAHRGIVESQLERVQERFERAGGSFERLPLYGVPFAVKDNIDVAGFPTTAACPKFETLPGASAPVVETLMQAGAVMIGKTNLDQFATGLVGTRSPYGVVPNTFDPRYIAGGSSSGSAAVVSLGVVPFALGTDTAGSGRVPAAFGNVVGLKPTRGWLSTRGVVPACRTLDCVSVFALGVADAIDVARLCAGHDALDSYSRRAPRERPRRCSDPAHFAVPREPSFFGDQQAARAFEGALEVMRGMGVVLTPIDFTPFNELQKLLYEGPWVCERYAVAERLLAEDAAAVHPVVRSILEGSRRHSGLDAFRYEYRRAELASHIARIIEGFDAVVVPTTPTIYLIEEVLADPFETSARLGTYTNFTNLADLSAVSLPGPFRSDGLPAAITLLARAFHDEALADFGGRFQAELALPFGATGRVPALAALSGFLGPVLGPDERTELVVVGAHMRGMPLNAQLADCGARFVVATRTAAAYRLYALPGTVPTRPGLLRVEAGGGAIDVEVWSMPLAEFGRLVAQIPSPLGMGRIELASGEWVQGFLCESWAVRGAADITSFGGFRAYLERS